MRWPATLSLWDELTGVRVTLYLRNGLIVKGEVTKNTPYALEVVGRVGGKHGEPEYQLHARTVGGGRLVIFKDGIDAIGL